MKEGLYHSSRLEAELERLKQLTGLGHQLQLSWRPDGDSDLHGEVKGNLILIYDCDKEAFNTLRHEFLDQIISREIIEPLVKQINMQKRLIESLIYGRKEMIIERFIRLLDEYESAKYLTHLIF